MRRIAIVGFARPRTVDEGVEDELPVLLDEVVDVSEDSAHDCCEVCDVYVGKRKRERERAAGGKIDGWQPGEAVWLADLCVKSERALESWRGGVCASAGVEKSQRESVSRSWARM